MISFSHFPQAPWTHRRPTNVIESPFAAVRLRTTAAKRDKRVANAPVVSWKTRLLAESRFRRLDAPPLLAEVADWGDRQGWRTRKESERRGRRLSLLTDLLG